MARGRRRRAAIAATAGGGGARRRHRGNRRNSDGNGANAGAATGTGATGGATTGTARTPAPRRRPPSIIDVVAGLAVDVLVVRFWWNRRRDRHGGDPGVVLARRLAVRFRRREPDRPMSM